MKRIYESLYEIAEDFCNGEHWTHLLSDHSPDECYAWQHGVYEFAKFLDSAGVQLVQNPNIYPKLWEEIRTHKPRKTGRHPKEEHNVET
jgi:hypothetical protein